MKPIQVRRLIGFAIAVAIAWHLWGWEYALFVWMFLGALEPA